MYLLPTIKFYWEFVVKIIVSSSKIRNESIHLMFTTVQYGTKSSQTQYQLVVCVRIYYKRREIKIHI